ncbi:MAG: DeoR family transcriptional regulator [Thalassobius sp.]|nr:DeoR family transcriptional regulator [Thalassovita sp.]
MLKEERHSAILNEIRLHNRVLLTDLSNLLMVSEDTVRRDLKELDKQGLIKKVHGGAISTGYHSHDQIYAHDSKVTIARKAINLLKSGQVILITGGTTNYELARMIPKKLNATFITPSLSTAMQLLSHRNIEVIFLGGKLSNEGKIALGGSVINALTEIKADICFLGTGYLDTQHGLTEFDWEVVQIKKAMIKSSTKVVSLAISEKLDSFQRYRVCDIQHITTLITELDKNDEKFTPYKQMGVEIL